MFSSTNINQSRPPPPESDLETDSGTPMDWLSNCKPPVVHQWRVQDFFPDGGINLLFSQFFPENCMKMKEIRSKGALFLDVPFSPVLELNFKMHLVVLCGTWPELITSWFILVPSHRGSSAQFFAAMLSQTFNTNLKSLKISQYPPMYFVREL